MPQNIFPDRLLILFPIPSIGRPAAASLQSLEVTESGRQVEIGPMPLDPASIGSYSEAFRIPLIAEREQLQTQVQSLSEEKQQLELQIQSLSEELSQCNASLAAANNEIDTLEARVAMLLEAVPFNPRIIDSSSFLKRLTSEEAFRLVGHPNETVQEVVEMLNQYKDNDWPIMLDHEITQQAFSALVQIGIVTESRKNELLRDASREEAYSAEVE